MKNQQDNKELEQKIEQELGTKNRTKIEQEAKELIEVLKNPQVLCQSSTHHVPLNIQRPNLNVYNNHNIVRMLINSPKPPDTINWANELTQCDNSQKEGSRGKDRTMQGL